LDLVLAEWKEGRTLLTRPPVEGSARPQEPRDPFAEMERLESLGERYVKARTGMTTAELAELKKTPQGAALLTSVGGDITTQLKVLEFEDTMRQRWAKHDAEMERYKRETDRKEREAETFTAAKKEVTGGVGKLLDASARAMDAVRKRAQRQTVEEQAAATSQNPKCKECGGELATGGPEGGRVCQGCGRTFPGE
ncbi:MAG: hypothetical protein C0405_14185, partial [Desulfovibrio sp.]|nr:hypothetical protein [Desulfovibrio sp.]